MSFIANDAGVASQFPDGFTTGAARGLVTAPLWRLADSQTGFYSPGTDQISLASNGVQSWAVSATGGHTIGASSFTTNHTVNGGLTIGSGTSANTSIWAAASALRFRGGTNGYEWRSTGDATLSAATDAGVWSFGLSSGASSTHIFQSGAQTYLSINSTGINDAALVLNGNGSTNTGIGNYIFAYINAGGDTGNQPALVFDSRRVGNAALTGRPLFSFRNAGTYVLESGVSGAWSVGPVTANNATGGQAHTINGHLFGGGTSGTAAGDKQFIVGTNLNVAAAPRTGRISATTTGSGVLFQNTTSNTLDTCSFYANFFNDATSTSATQVGSYNARSDWKLGVTDNTTAQHFLYGLTFIKQGGTSGGSALQNTLYVVKNTGSGNNSGDIYITFHSAGNTATPIFNIQANGTSGAFAAASDARLKENINDLSSTLEKINQLRPVKFFWKGKDAIQEGFIAQELQNIFPEDVYEGANGYLQVTGWGKTEARLVKAIQELTAEFRAYVAAHP
jgi:hypothetical protein